MAKKRCPYQFTILAIACLILFMSFSGANAQNNQNRSTELATEINRAVQKRATSPDLKDKVIRRISECAFIYGTLSKVGPDTETKQKLSEAADISLDVMVLVAKDISMDRYKLIVNSAKNSIVQLMKRQEKKELASLLRSCKSFSAVKDIDDGVVELTF